jgi:NADH-quinone oxidoreductase E subunit
MAWIVENRRTQVVARRPEPYLTDDLKIDLASRYFPRYPNKRAVLLPALHAVQHEYGWIPVQAMEEIASFLELSPAEVLDTASFYEEYWLKPKGDYLIQVCRSLSCEICGSSQLTEHLSEELGVSLGETTPDGRFTLVELECLGACDAAPVALVNEVLYERITAESIDRLIAQLPKDPHDFVDPKVTWPVDGRATHGHHQEPGPAEMERTDRDPHSTRN